MSRSIQDYIMRLKARMTNSDPELDIISPWSNKLSNLERATFFTKVLNKVYANTYSLYDFVSDEKSLVKLFEKNLFLCWVIFHRSDLLAVTGIELPGDGTASLISSASSSNIGGIGKRMMIQRIIDLLNQEQLVDHIWSIDGDVRLTQELHIRSGEKIEGGAKSQHINEICELTPFLLVVPRYFLHFEGCIIQQFFFFSRKYLNMNAISLNETIHCPTSGCNSNVYISDIARVTYKKAFTTTPSFNSEVVSSNRNFDPIMEIDRSGRQHHTAIRISGIFSKKELEDIICNNSSLSSFLEFVVPNRPENIVIQRLLLELGAIPLGVLPGGGVELGKFKTETTIHYGFLFFRKGAVFSKIELCNEYLGSDLETITGILYSEWETKAGLK